MLKFIEQTNNKWQMIILLQKVARVLGSTGFKITES